MKQALLAAAAVLLLAGCAGDSGLSARAEQPTAAFRQGQAARQAWEDWLGRQPVAYRAGARYWAGELHLTVPGACYVPANEVGGCLAAQKMLAAVERRRRKDLDYRNGWDVTPPAVIAARVQRAARVERAARAEATAAAARAAAHAAAIAAIPPRVMARRFCGAVAQDVGATERRRETGWTHDGPGDAAVDLDMNAESGWLGIMGKEELRLKQQVYAEAPVSVWRARLWAFQTCREDLAP